MKGCIFVFDINMEKRFVEGCILAIISKGETYTFKILEELVSLGFDDINDGSLYSVIRNLEKMKLITCKMGISEHGVDRKYYSLTRSGMVYLDSFKKYYIGVVNKTSILLFNRSTELL